MTQSPNNAVRINIAPLIEAHKKLTEALQLVQSQPGVGPLITVHVGLVSAKAVLGEILQGFTAEPSVAVPDRSLIVPPGN